MLYIMCAVIVLFLIFTFLFWQTDNVFKRRMKILNAIHDYNCDKILKDPECSDKELISYGCMESFEATCHRFWDFTITRIVPKEIYIRIKDYIR